MESSKIKNFIICILVVVNLFLAGLLSVDWVQTNRTRIQAEETAYAILENYGIAMDGVTLPDNSALNGHSLRRDFQREQELVSAVLGEVSVEDQGGNIMYYYGEKVRQTSVVPEILRSCFTPMLFPWNRIRWKLPGIS